ncbi:MAG: 16S rRNA (cytosine(1402)-N(4))-methyltransferase RsmH [Deltaproteobacteria bacterium]|nr:16S rRNA (cytosine(1402)-N(4))-methyltransferase RsmH [Deltaproteobacteria bacterium]
MQVSTFARFSVRWGSKRNCILRSKRRCLHFLRRSRVVHYSELFLSAGRCEIPSSTAVVPLPEARARPESKRRARLKVGTRGAQRVEQSGQREIAHTPVLLKEVTSFLVSQRDTCIVDVTVGLGGHAEALLQADMTLELLGIDRDEEALSVARERLAPFGKRVRLVHGTFRELPQLLQQAGWEYVDGIFADLGVSSLQLDRGARGMSFRLDAPLDMRMDQHHGMTAAEWLASATEEEMADVFWQLGEERSSRRIARHLVRRRGLKPFETTTDLAHEVASAVGQATHRRQRIHPATRVFQALRIFLNDELGELAALLETAPKLLRPRGHMVVISYHSLEDRLVKRCFRSLDRCGFQLPVRRVVRPSDEEVVENPRARSAKLRVLERGDVR